MLLERQADFRKLQLLPFCYLCGADLSAAPADMEHVLARALFAKSQRTPPLKLPSHAKCNNSRSGDDEAVGQLVTLLHGLAPSRTQRLGLSTTLKPDGKLSVSTTLDLRGCVWRWVRGFHAVLYRQYLPDDTSRAIFPPLPSVEIGRKQSDDRLYQLAHIVGVLKNNRVAGRLDAVVSNAGRCRYECTWDRADSGEWICFFGLRLYHWETLGDPSFPQRGCCGSYLPLQGLPEGASTATALPMAHLNQTPLDPFGS